MTNPEKHVIEALAIKGATKDKRAVTENIIDGDQAFDDLAERNVISHEDGQWFLSTLGVEVLRMMRLFGDDKVTVT